ncbi:hypothetical protein C7B62_12750 [Pleurocapsa sp. CCALA 161]|uniref:sulfotransferase n=1 Tax=Pleurocapsa sp. CCALA 161 TaxID=2107688 RepID=UPI000D06F2AC|nr:sulfotransferase [Pleurocapsa sp. CCALA 161]PSB09556.1 hypothetical protein C7B62_12750 [Pleurocapsa sp. CCALA 161]
MNIKIAVDKIKNWVFVTGVPRSGTTFAGTVLSLPLQVDYIHEPFNPTCGIAGTDLWYPYFSNTTDTEDKDRYHDLIKSIFSYDFSLKNNIPPDDSLVKKIGKKVVGSRGPFNLTLAKLNPLHEAAIIKDPTGIFLTEYLYLNYGVKPVIIVRHPTSLIASLKRLDWVPNLARFHDKPHLIDDYFSEERELLTKEWSNSIQKSSVHWKAAYKVMLEQASKYPDWQVVTHEDLSQKPVDVFHSLYEKLNLPWSESVKQKIINLTKVNKSAQARQGKVQDFKRNSAKIFDMYRQSLTIVERQEIFEIVKDVALQVYTEKSFALD